MSTRPASLSPPRLSLFYRQTVPVSLAGGVSFFPFPDTPLLSGCLLSGMLRCCTFNGGICNWIVIEFSWKWICQLYIYIYILKLKLRNEIYIEKQWLEDWASSLNFIWDWIRGVEYLLSVSVSTVDRFSKRFNRRFSLSLAPISRFSLPLPPPAPSPGVGRKRESPLPERSYRRRKLQASACSCEKGLETAGGVKTTPAFEAEVWKIRYPSSLSHGLLDYGMAL